jgi:hypothetical protein
MFMLSFIAPIIVLSMFMLSFIAPTIVLSMFMMIDFRRVFRDGANVERINFRGGIVGNVKKKKDAVPSIACITNLKIYILI